MDSIICPECGKEIPGAKSTCPICGFPISEELRSGQMPTENTNIKKPRGKKKIVPIIMASAVVVLLVIGFFVFMKMRNPLNGKAYCYYINDREQYSLIFSEKTLTLHHEYFNDAAWSPSGKYIDKSKSTEETYQYELISRSEFSCKGKTYTFKQKRSGHNDVIEFDSKFMGIARTWN